MLRGGYIDVPLTGLNNIVHAEDVATAVIGCADRRQGSPREEYIINGEAILYSEWIAALEKYFALTRRRRLPYLVSALFRGPLAALARRLRWRRAIKVPEYKAALYRLCTSYSSEKAGHHFDYRPTRFFREEMKVGG
jgi:nucleoside-diphosphate-sugar epimerase